ncbi:hypothetical protein [Halococcoides cellulosivorans]|uniref:Uncharacterized protein n=1 Tax=Halococcoides cellulosivorans TaxID=1679096 RepID=A0A2R4X280_9EURY|nr:hypothetical protein [Halococcoides cellulosivorans]AWB27885.1 hypothetical protein HARCEL1_09240 [Halococcoides cellulosivorans]
MDALLQSTWGIDPGAFALPAIVWLVLAVTAVANGIFRETVLTARYSERRAHRISTAMLVAIILTIAGLYFASFGEAHTLAERLAIGVGWTALTVGFEFLVGHLEDTPVEETIGQYDVRAGEVWIAVPLTLLLSPLLFGWLL